MSTSLLATLSRRERDIMDILFRRGRATAEEVMHALSGDPSYSTVRTQLRVLEEKGHVRHVGEGRTFVYMPSVPRSAARKAALRRVVETFFDGSVERVVAALLGGEAVRLSDEELRRIESLVEQARTAQSSDAESKRGKPDESRSKGERVSAKDSQQEKPQ
jgi:predicted transcriptional regulator